MYIYFATKLHWQYDLGSRDVTKFFLSIYAIM